MHSLRIDSRPLLHANAGPIEDTGIRRGICPWWYRTRRIPRPQTFSGIEGLRLPLVNET